MASNLNETAIYGMRDAYCKACYAKLVRPQHWKYFDYNKERVIEIRKKKCGSTRVITELEIWKVDLLRWVPRGETCISDKWFSGHETGFAEIDTAREPVCPGLVAHFWHYF